MYPSRWKSAAVALYSAGHGLSRVAKLLGVSHVNVLLKLLQPDK